jgi:hypothetical protein
MSRRDHARQLLCALVVATVPALATALPSTAGAVPAARAPSASTGYAQALTATTASVRARIDPHGVPTEYRVEYGATAAYGSQTPAASAGSATSENVYTVALSGLTPYTTYHYRVLATSSAGTAVGKDATFVTKKQPLALSLDATPNPVVFGRALTVSGTLSGTGNGGVDVVLQGAPFPFAHGFHDITSPELTSATGAYSFPLTSLLETTELRVATVAKPIVHSAIATESVALDVTLHVRPTHRRGYVRLFGSATPDVAGARVAFERRSSKHRYVTVSGTIVKGTVGEGGHFSRIVRLSRRGVYRALVQIPSGAQISGRSTPILIR